MNIFAETIKKYPLTQEKFYKFIKGHSLEVPEDKDKLREAIYKFIKTMAFRVNIDYLALYGERRVIMELYLGADLVAYYEMLDNIDNIWNRIFISAFEYMEAWYQENKDNKLILGQESKGRHVVR